MRARILAIFVIIIVIARSAPSEGSTVNTVLRENSLPPIGHSIFCQRYPQDCTIKPPSARFLMQSAKTLYDDLEVVHRRVNVSIRPVYTASRKADATEEWKVSPSSGNCNDFAVSKRHDLLQRGWPSWALLLAEVTLNSGEHHLVLVVNLRGESYVLDNLETNPVALLETGFYRWNRIESPDDPQLWLSMDSGGKPSGDRSKLHVVHRAAR